ncbi:MAG: tetraacyldisaccharide 4'-kinase, partial [Pirellula sp.]
VLLLDDGFQHRKIHRDLEIVLLDSREPFGFGHLLPRGLLREPLSSLRRASIVIATRATQVDAQTLAEMRTRVQRYNPKAAWLEAEHHPVRMRNSNNQTHPTDWLADKKVIAICGLGNPSGFHATLKSCGATVLEAISFPDHHPYSALDMADVERRAASCSAACEAIVCTGKDLAKIDVPRLGAYPLWSLDVELRIRTGADVLNEYLDRIRSMCIE